MSVIIGSARIDENGRATYGRAGDQTGREVATQDWYQHSKGWRVFRPKRPKVAEAVAVAMEHACANDKIGYDQEERFTAYDWCKYENGGVATLYFRWVTVGADGRICSVSAEDATQTVSVITDSFVN